MSYQEALINLANSLEEWKSAGGDVLQVVGAIQQLYFALEEQKND